MMAVLSSELGAKTPPKRLEISAYDYQKNTFVTATSSDNRIPIPEKWNAVFSVYFSVIVPVLVSETLVVIFCFVIFIKVLRKIRRKSLGKLNEFCLV